MAHVKVPGKSSRLRLSSVRTSGLEKGVVLGDRAVSLVKACNYETGEHPEMEGEPKINAGQFRYAEYSPISEGSGKGTVRLSWEVVRKFGDPAEILTNQVTNYWG